MTKEENLQKINKELKVYINESSFISKKCRNKLLRLFEDEFDVSLDIGNYQNVDLQVLDDYKFLYREDTYESNSKINSLEEFLERYGRFQEKADTLIRRREVDFQGRRNFNNFTNLIVIACILFILVGILILGVHSFLIGDYFDCIWLIVFIVPWIVPKLKSNLKDRLIQAKHYIKSLLKKVK